MRISKRTAIKGLASAALASMLLIAGCGGRSDVTIVEGKTNVVASFYPLSYMAKEIGGEYVNAINLVPTGVEPHDWSPNSRERKAIEDADVLLYNGAGLEGWVDDVLDSLDKTGMIVVEASKGLDLIRVDEKDADEHGAEESGHEHEHEDEQHESGHGHQHESDVDPHVWVSPKQAIRIAENVFKGIVEADPAHREAYQANYEKLVGQLQALDEKYRTQLGQTARKEIVVTHDAFSYLARDYGLKQMSLMGLAPDAEPTPKDIQRINEFVREHGIRYLFFEELVSDKLAKTLANDAKIDTLVLNPLEGLTDEQEKAGETLLSLMETNLQNLLKALQ
ncbi:metal ABC transporter substrate-binding protein [Paenibacillus thermoaerophilus]|uniref:Metal ABC transporter substrate-binding protein n=1 Tax=Paenibacillus thermoaerophilus TaxID=1215385 RepID=A0ABW2V2G5_9BACL|nr:metal ABC transporter substrate-binding protein [Paenibacillus thermoaerophilus]TMV18808.1 zinc ABC transporter substrate-binding protein [Paenibacillus thermoaerophilus]